MAYKEYLCQPSKALIVLLSLAPLCPTKIPENARYLHMAVGVQQFLPRVSNNSLRIHCAVNPLAKTPLYESRSQNLNCATFLAYLCKRDIETIERISGVGCCTKRLIYLVENKLVTF